MALENLQHIFGYIFRVSNQLQVSIDQTLKDDNLTAKQFFLMIVINSFEDKPTLTDIAYRFGSSRQNAKQLVNKLVDNNYVMQSKDDKDLRSLNFSLTDKALKYWADRDDGDLGRMNRLFKDMDDDMILNLLQGLTLMMSNMEEMNNENNHTI